MMSDYSWPKWIERVINEEAGTVQLTVRHGSLSHSWEARRGESTSRETQRIATQILLNLIKQQQTIDAITIRLTRKSSSMFNKI
jgi:hypothetical protein